MESISVEPPKLTSIQKAKSKYYFKNKAVISDAYKVYYQKNKEEISKKRREKSMLKRTQRTANELAQLLNDT
jgi:hypothetical protein